MLGPSFLPLSCSRPKTFARLECVALNLPIVDLMKVGSSKVPRLNRTAVPLT